MAVTMSSATVDQSKRNELLDQNLRKSTLGNGEELNQTFNIASFRMEASGNNVAGITADFLPKFENAIENYETEVKNAIQELANTTDDHMDEAFKGTAIANAISSFVESVKDVANNYLNTLKNAELQIAQSVQSAYQQQDTDISSDLNKDSSTLVDAGPNA